MLTLRMTASLNAGGPRHVHNPSVAAVSVMLCDTVNAVMVFTSFQPPRVMISSASTNSRWPNPVKGHDDIQCCLLALTGLDHVIPLPALSVGQNLGVAIEELRGRSPCCPSGPTTRKSSGSRRLSSELEDIISSPGKTVGVLRPESTAERTRVRTRRTYACVCHRKTGASENSCPRTASKAAWQGRPSRPTLGRACRYRWWVLTRRRTPCRSRRGLATIRPIAVPLYSELVFIRISCPKTASRWG